ncbi:VOC family protein [Cryptosporangium aurantiacum]|uniref:VOC domain-containing protein n=1 Tax=Cryptosporangium aurantiacum TaxID=134849 RepID=A0A1M7PDU3_9ACTN|nr:hypothetical protein [Cryptosporangium aurantiacum]SHN15185.1 hypothetical protein SAMN05443668_103256 [Cryptosporangium aurantiacum]
MTARSLAPVLPVDDLLAAVAVYTRLLGVLPTFVDGDRWAQFDLAGHRLALAGRDRAADHPGVLLKVDDLRSARAEAVAAGLPVEEIQTGPHEHRCVVTGPGGWPVVLYSPAPKEQQ